MNIGSNNTFSNVIRQHGREVLNMLRKTEKTVRKIARWVNRKVYNVRCRKMALVPPSVRLTSNIVGIRANKILSRAEHQLLDVRIRQCDYTIKKLTEEKVNLISKLDGILSPQLQAEVKALLLSAHAHTYESTKMAHRARIERLIQKHQDMEPTQVHSNTSVDTNRWVVNLSECELSQAKLSVLKKGLNFAVTPTDIPVDEIIAGTELAIQHLDQQTAAQLRKPNITKAERSALNNLRKNTDIMILPADKGKATVVMDTSKYQTQI